jgi:uncharacterized protein YciI
MQFVVTALDYSDSDALSRRMEHREQHLAGVRKLIAEGHFLSGGAILDDEGKMVGSTLHMDFQTRAELDALLGKDPYVTGRVWEKIDVRQVKLVPVK